MYYTAAAIIFYVVLWFYSRQLSPLFSVAIVSFMLLFFRINVNILHNRCIIIIALVFCRTYDDKVHCFGVVCRFLCIGVVRLS